VTTDRLFQEYQQALFEEIKQARILIVDDDPITLEMLQEVFVTHGYTNLALAENGRLALDKTLEWNPSLVLLDLSMPEMDGYEYCQQLRQHSAFRNTPVLVQSSLSDPWQVVAAFEAGATDMVNKPFNEREVLARARVHLSNSALLSELRKFQQRIQEELDIARAMQTDLLPSRTLIEQMSEAFGLDIVSCFRTSSELGGDFMGICAASANHCAFHVTDFSGHGINAALNTFRLHTLLEEHQEYLSEPARYLTQLNEHLCDLLSSGQFATMFYGVFDRAAGQLRYAATGCPGPVFVMADGTMRDLDSSGLPMGISKSLFEAEERVLEFQPGDTLWLFSDALVECKNLARDMFGVTRFKEILARHRDQDSQRQLNAVLQALKIHTSGIGIEDDLTVLGIRRRG
jgi:sigma-B regulation protein RsbU (phosphoserine phosphatase)